MDIYNSKLEYYVYAYVRKDGTPYYIGKGKGKRVHHSHNGRLPKDKSCIVIMENNLSEIGAFALERFYIRWYGRKDNETGILRNLTDGGDGISGFNHSEETKRKIGESNSRVLKGIVPWNKGKKGISEETRQKLRQAKLGKPGNRRDKKKTK